MELEDWFDTAIGLAIGQKWISNNGFVFELSAGAGRYLLDSNDSPNAFLKADFWLGIVFKIYWLKENSSRVAFRS
ncbi:hypothetical protein ACFQO1_04630 [Jejudonia soesokkakensis]|uniref:Uncharacterized protein n=1 Tax=Jejudonia soesokkakensis TaxID=1323432 RepID=A0ABW2MSV2_9FLAO